MDSENNNNAATLVAALTAAQSLARPCGIYGSEVPAAVIPEGYRLEMLERALRFPARQRGFFDVQTAEAFTRLVNLLDKSVVDPDERGKHFPIFFARSGSVATATAVLNSNTWRDHGVKLTLALSQPFRDWVSFNAKDLQQRAFALFLEERTAHVVKPEGAALLELARKFKANTSVRYQSIIEKDNGDQSLEFMQTTEAGNASAKSHMKVPSTITLLLPVWHGAEPVKVEARFSYDISGDGKLTLKYEILRLEELLANELRAIVAAIGKQLPDSLVIEGGNEPVRSL